ncbi:MAG: ROK family protein [Bacteroidales bacterium]|nr:ROK family protein [Bacteroidales bacterium]
MIKVVAGIDVGGTFTKFGIVDKAGKVYADDSISTDAHEDIEKYLDQLAGAIRKLLEKSGNDLELQGIGVGAPNANYYSGAIENAPNLKWKGEIPLAAMLGSRFDVPIAVTNDANAAAIGEMMYGGARGMKDFIVITLGTGLGSGIVVNGRVVYGHDGFAGELGHVNVFVDGRHCGCGRKGCLETYVSATGIKRTVYELLARRTDKSELRKIPFNKLTAKNISREADMGDSIALKAFEMTGRILGKSLADVVALFSPEAIFLLGGLAKAGDHIFVPARGYMEKNLLELFRNKVKILTSELRKTNAGVLGAAGLIWNEISN